LLEVAISCALEGSHAQSTSASACASALLWTIDQDSDFGQLVEKFREIARNRKRMQEN